MPTNVSVYIFTHGLYPPQNATKMVSAIALSVHPNQPDVPLKTEIEVGGSRTIIPPPPNYCFCESVFRKPRVSEGGARRLTLLSRDTASDTQVLNSSGFFWLRQVMREIAAVTTPWGERAQGNPYSTLRVTPSHTPHCE